MYNEISSEEETLKKIFSNNFSFSILKGGINNPTYLIHKNNSKYVVKFIKHPKSSKYDRYIAEKELLILANTLNIAYVPKLIMSLDVERVLLLEYIKPDTSQNLNAINSKKIIECCNFIKMINSQPDIAKKIVTQNASESHLDLSGHIININNRLNIFQIDHLPFKYRSNFEEFLNILKNNWLNIENESIEYINKYPELNNIDERYQIVSPSDFGFHNIIIKNKICHFIDFEFSGWDDPAKLYSDFVLQPKYKIPLEFHKLLYENFFSNEYSIIYETRIPVLKKLLNFKWLTIEFSFFNKQKFISEKYNRDNLEKIKNRSVFNTNFLTGRLHD